MTESNPTTLRVSGAFTSEVGAALLENIREACGAPGATVVVNLEEATGLDSRGLGILLQGAKIAKEAGATLTIGQPSPQVKRIMQITGIDGVLPLSA